MLELRPKLSWNKGTALAYLTRRLSEGNSLASKAEKSVSSNSLASTAEDSVSNMLDSQDLVPIYLGDDR